MQIPEFLLNLIPLAGAPIISLLCKTLRVEHEDIPFKESLLDSGQGIIFCFWHDRLLYLSYLHGWKGINVLISQSRDGELIAKVMARFGYTLIRGSTSKGGAQAMRQLVKAAQSGRHTAVPTDGPRGPRHIVQPGVIQLARLSGKPILPLSFSAKWKKTFHSWDQFLLPLPFSRGRVVYGQPLYVPSHCGKDEMETYRIKLEGELKLITIRADAYFE